MKPLVAEGLTSAVMDYVQALDLGYVPGENFIAGQMPLDVRDLAGLLQGAVVLSVYDEPSELIQSGRQTHQDRVYRFVVKGGNPQSAVEQAWRVCQAFWNRRAFEASAFRILVMRVAKTPTALFRADDGTALADFVVLFRALNR